MRLRRETGDFQIRVTVDDGTVTVNSIAKGLLAEDFVGQVVDVDGAFEVVTAVSENKLAGTVSAVTATYTLTYTKGTGAITGAENE